MKEKPNVILIGIDTLRADHLGVYGHKTRPTSPNIDALAKDAILFQNCRSQAPHTAPSFMSIMTGRYPTYHGVTLNSIRAKNGKSRIYGLDRSIPTIASVLQKNGYRTGAFTDGGQLAKRFGFAKGFEYYSINLDGDEAEKRAHGIIPENEIFYWLKEAAPVNFFMFFHTYAVHSHWCSPMNYRMMFTPNYKGPLLNVPLKSEIKANVHGHFIKTARGLDAEEIWHHEAMYDGAIRYMDDFFGRLINYLSDLKILENTIIIFTSDHGEEFLDHGKISHEQLYKELLHVPLIIKIPQTLHSTPYTLNPKPNTPYPVSQLVRSIDIFPTIVDLLQCEPELTNGTSLLPALNQDLDLPALADSERHGIALENKNFKYILHRRKPNIDELYQLASDPQEKINIATENPERVEEMLYDFDTDLHKIPFSRPKRKIIWFPNKTKAESDFS